MAAVTTEYGEWGGKWEEKKLSCILKNLPHLVYTKAYMYYVSIKAVQYPHNDNRENLSLWR